MCAAEFCKFSLHKIADSKNHTYLLRKYLFVSTEIQFSNKPVGLVAIIHNNRKAYYLNGKCTFFMNTLFKLVETGFLFVSLHHLNIPSIR